MSLTSYQARLSWARAISQFDNSSGCNQTAGGRVYWVPIGPISRKHNVPTLAFCLQLRITIACCRCCKLRPPLLQLHHTLLCPSSHWPPLLPPLHTGLTRHSNCRTTYARRMPAHIVLCDALCDACLPLFSSTPALSTIASRARAHCYRHMVDAYPHGHAVLYAQWMPAHRYAHPPIAPSTVANRVCPPLHPPHDLHMADVENLVCSVRCLLPCLPAAALVAHHCSHRPPLLPSSHTILRRT